MPHNEDYKSSGDEEKDMAYYGSSIMEMIEEAMGIADDEQSKVLDKMARMANQLSGGMMEEEEEGEMMPQRQNIMAGKKKVIPRF